MNAETEPEARARMQRTDPPRASRPAPHGAGATVLAFDFGEKRIGVAVGDTVVSIAHPLTTILAADKQRRYAAIAVLIEEWRPLLLVVGLPAYLDGAPASRKQGPASDGAEHELSRLARKFARELTTRFGLPVEFVDERLTSVAAATSLIEAGVAPRRHKPLLDQVAAQQILQSYLDAQTRPA